jgi:hypothetical protein
MVQLSAIRCSCIAILWVSIVSFAAITLCVASQRVFVVVVIDFVIDLVRKLLDTPSYVMYVLRGFVLTDKGHQQPYQFTKGAYRFRYLQNAQTSLHNSPFPQPQPRGEIYLRPLTLLNRLWAMWSLESPNFHIYILHIPAKWRPI